MEYNFTKGSMPPIYMLLNCTAHLFGPRLYEQFFFEHDLEIIRMFYDNNQRYMLHHCGYFDIFASMYRRIPHADMVQIGSSSNPQIALEAFPEADIEYVVSPIEVLTYSKEQLRDRVTGLLSSAGDGLDRFSLVVADLETGTPDENIVEIYNCCKNIV